MLDTRNDGSGGTTSSTTSTSTTVTRNITGGTVIVSPDHPTNEAEFNQQMASGQIRAPVQGNSTVLPTTQSTVSYGPEPTYRQVILAPTNDAPEREMGGMVKVAADHPRTEAEFNAFQEAGVVTTEPAQTEPGYNEKREELLRRGQYGVEPDSGGYLGGYYYQQDVLGQWVITGNGMFLPVNRPMSGPDVNETAYVEVTDDSPVKSINMTYSTSEGVKNMETAIINPGSIILNTPYNPKTSIPVVAPTGLMIAGLWFDKSDMRFHGSAQTETAEQWAGSWSDLYFDTSRQSVSGPGKMDITNQPTVATYTSGVLPRNPWRTEAAQSPWAPKNPDGSNATVIGTSAPAAPKNPLIGHATSGTQSFGDFINPLTGRGWLDLRSPYQKGQSPTEQLGRGDIVSFLFGNQQGTLGPGGREWTIEDVNAGRVSIHDYSVSTGHPSAITALDVPLRKWAGSNQAAQLGVTAFSIMPSFALMGVGGAGYVSDMSKLGVGNSAARTAIKNGLAKNDFIAYMSDDTTATLGGNARKPKKPWRNDKEPIRYAPGKAPKDDAIPKPMDLSKSPGPEKPLKKASPPPEVSPIKPVSKPVKPAPAPLEPPHTKGPVILEEKPAGTEGALTKPQASARLQKEAKEIHIKVGDLEGVRKKVKAFREGGVAKKVEVRKQVQDHAQAQLQSPVRQREQYKDNVDWQRSKYAKKVGQKDSYVQLHEEYRTTKEQFEQKTAGKPKVTTEAEFGLKFSAIKGGLATGTMSAAKYASQFQKQTQTQKQTWRQDQVQDQRTVVGVVTRQDYKQTQDQKQDTRQESKSIYKNTPVTESRIPRVPALGLSLGGGGGGGSSHFGGLKTSKWRNTAFVEDSKPSTGISLGGFAPKKRRKK